MQQRGRKKSAFSVVPLPGQRHAPPDYLTAEQQDIWREIAATKPADWFCADSYPLLAQYCRHIASVNLLARQIDAISDLGTREASNLLRLRIAESKTLLLLASSMRLTQQSRYKSETAATAHANSGSDADKPWQQNA